VAFLLCGATCIQVGTATYTNPTAALEIRDGLAGYCERHAVERARDLIGALEADSR
jgi:dihydroorotate dehydrogenase (NAD+) catalytic subunit